jgi:hypothetical protein
VSHQPGHGGETGLLQQEAARYGVPLGMPGAGAGGGFSGLMQEPAVTVRSSNVRPTPSSPDRPYQVRTTPDIQQRPLSSLLTEFDSYTVQQKRELAKDMIRAGLLPEPPQGMTIDEWVKKIPLSQVRSAYGALLEDTAERNASGQPTLTPVELLDQQIAYYKDNFKGGKVAGAEGEEPFTGVKKDKSTHVDIYSPTEAKGLIRSVLKGELGREPTEDEFEDFRASLNAELEDNPAVSVTRTRYEEGEVVGSRTRTSGGIDTGEYATQWAQSQPGWAEWQAVGTYFPTVMNMLGSGVPGV